jgi:nucleoside-diphosphate-sugar epimerase
MISISDFADSALGGENLSEFHRSKVCFLGGTGFIGTWLVSSLNYLSLTQDIELDLTIYTRNKSAALVKFPHISFKRIKIEEFDFSQGICDLGMYDFFVNGATPSSTKPGANSREIFYTPTINAINSIIESARRYGNCPRVMNLSSGAAYGDQPMDLLLRPEGPAKSLEGSDDDYRASKIVSEEMLAKANDQKILKATSPRLFTFYGPGLPINQHFAIGNFIGDGLNGDPIRVQGSPATRRSYMFPTDLVSWLLKSILDPKDGNFNIGSERSISMLELATMVSELTSKKGVVLLNPETPANNYVPSTEKFRSVHNVKENTELENGLMQWAKWLLKQE